MSVSIDKKLIDLINSRESKKILGTVNNVGEPHVVIKNSLYINDEGNLVYFEINEESRSYKNFTNSLWFNKTVAVNILGTNNESYLIKGNPLKIHVSGKVYEESYKAIRARLGDIDLAAVCVIKPIEIINKTPNISNKTNEDFIHLDRLLK